MAEQEEPRLTPEQERLAEQIRRSQPRQIPGMARLLELTPELWEHYSG